MPAGQVGSPRPTGVNDPGYDKRSSKTRAHTRYRAKHEPMAKTRKKPSHRWSAKVTKQSNALDLAPDVFKSKDPRRIALSLKRSAEQSKRRKGTPYQSAMSMLNFYINRAGKNLPEKQKRVLEQAKDQLRDVF